MDSRKKDSSAADPSTTDVSGTTSTGPGDAVVDGSADVTAHDNVPAAPEQAAHAVEIGGRGGPDPTRYGDWEKAGRCIDF